LIKASFHQPSFKPSQIKRLTDKKATKKAILENIKSWLINDTKAQDKVLFYYSGHGGQIEDQPPIDESGTYGDKLDETLAPSDTYEVKTAGKTQFANMILDDTLKILFKHLEKKGVEVLIIIDSCHSGTVTRDFNDVWETEMVKSISPPQPKPVSFATVIGTRGYQRSKNEPSFMDDLNDTPLRTVWSAVSPAQLAFVNQNKEMGVFTHLLVEGLKQDTDNKISNAELFSYIQKGSSKYCNEVSAECALNQGALTPMLEISPNKRLASFSQSGFTLPPAANDDTIFESSFSSLNWQGLKVKIKQGKTLSLNQSIRIDVENTSHKKGQLILLDHRADGQLIQLYPNKHCNKNKHCTKKPFEKSNKFYLPRNKQWGFSIKASVKGKSEIIALLIHDKVNLADIYSKTKG